MCFAPSQSHSLSIHPRVPSQLWKMRPSASPGQPWSAPNPPLHCLASSKEGRQPISETAKPGQARWGGGGGAPALQKRTHLFYLFPSGVAPVGQTDRQGAGWRLSLPSGRSCTSSASWLSGLHLVMKRWLGFILFLNFFITAFKNPKSRKKFVS